MKKTDIVNLSSVFHRVRFQPNGNNVLQFSHRVSSRFKFPCLSPLTVYVKKKK